MDDLKDAKDLPGVKEGLEIEKLIRENKKLDLETAQLKRGLFSRTNWAPVFIQLLVPVFAFGLLVFTGFFDAKRLELANNKFALEREVTAFTHTRDSLSGVNSNFEAVLAEKNATLDSMDHVIQNTVNTLNSTKKQVTNLQKDSAILKYYINVLTTDLSKRDVEFGKLFIENQRLKDTMVEVMTTNSAQLYSLNQMKVNSQRYSANMLSEISVQKEYNRGLRSENAILKRKYDSCVAEIIKLKK